MEWVLVLLVWTNGDPTPDGLLLGGLPSESLCWNRAKQDTPRVKHITAGKKFQWACIQQEATPKHKVEPSV